MGPCQRSWGPDNQSYIYIYICICGHLVNANGADAKVMNFDRLGKKGTPWHFWQYKSRLTGVTKRSLPLSKNMKFAVTPLVPTPFVPFRIYRYTYDTPIYIYIYIYMCICIYIYI